MDPLSVVQDEVALEGLDGITIPTLWIRLESRNPVFQLALDQHTKEFLWRSLVICSDLDFYQLPEERNDVILFDRFEDIDPETGMQAAQGFSDSKNDIYPIRVIDEEKYGIQGSCIFYLDRENVTEAVRSKDLTALITLEEAFTRYGRRLVVVASQEMRFRALIGDESDPELKLTDHSYCILERLGRARWQGELQRDLHTCSFKTDAGKLHYMRRSLDKHELITLQSHVQRLPSGQQQHSILLLLKRFHVIRRSKYDILTEGLSDILLVAPDQMAPMITLREQLNVSERTFKRIYLCMQAAKLVQVVNRPLETLNPSGGPQITARGTKVNVRCVQLVKPYVRKEVVVNDDDNEDENGAGKTLPPEGRVMERDLMLQAYEIVVSSGTIGISQSALQTRMHVGKLEVRMLVRMMQRSGMIKGFMEDEGRQRTTKYISHRCVGMSDLLHQFDKERERNQLLRTGKGAEGGRGGTPKTPKAAAAASKTPSASRSKTKAPQVKAVPPGKEGAEDSEEQSSDAGQQAEREGPGKEVERKPSEQTIFNVPITHSTPMKCKAEDPCQARTNKKSASQSLDSTVEGEGTSLDQSDASNSLNDSITVVEDIPKPARGPQSDKSNRCSLVDRPHETYRLLRRKNIIVESVRSLKIIEGLYTLQRMINEDEKLDGVRTKCCKKSILRLIRSLSREGMLKMYTTTVIQDGVSKKVEFVVHQSIEPTDPIVKSAIEQVRFRISSSYTVARAQQADDKAKGQVSEPKGKLSKAQKSKADKKKAEEKKAEAFKPTIVNGMSRSLGYQPKMHRLRLIHSFIWYVIHGHPLRKNPAGALPIPSRSPAETEGGADDDDANAADTPTETPAGTPEPLRPVTDDSNAGEEPPGGADGPASSSGDPAGNQQPTEPAGEEEEDEEDEEEEEEEEEQQQVVVGEEELMDAENNAHFHPDVKVYVDETSWRRFVPPTPVHREFGSGWALVSDLLLCLPLSLYVQVIQINYVVDGLEEYLNDPVKQHYLIRFLPSKTRRQMLYKRRYIFHFHENMQRLVYMGLLQFGPVEKFQDKDQVFVFLKRKATIVDTTCSEPHYWKVTQPPGKTFERRQYTLSTIEDVENYWFDLLCVCLNTALGVVRFRKGEEPEIPDRYRFLRLAHLLKGSREVCDDGTVPGDVRGAGGLDSEFFSHLKRNWLWTNPLLTDKKYRSNDEVISSKVRLKNLLSKNSSLLMALKAGGSTSPRCVTTKRPLMMLEDVEVVIEPASRNQQVVGGKKQPRKKGKKEVVAKVTRKRKKEPKKRTPAHDEADHRALKRMTRQRVYWSLQEDSMMMLCSVSSQLLNSKMKKPFVPYCVVRDMLHLEFEKSLDKTSLAVGRRTRYILKNPQTLLNYRICLAEVYQDKHLMALLDKNKPDNPDEPEECATAFSEYTRLLRQKFSTAMISSDINLPDTKRRLFSRFKVFTIDDGKQLTLKDTIKSMADIHAILLNNLIQSTLAMSNSQMKSCRSFQTFSTYSNYNQEVLCQVFLQCRRRGLVNRRRVGTCDGRKKNRALPILPMSYQLSQTYYRCFSWRFPYALCSDVFQFVRLLRANGTTEARPLTDFYHEPEERAEGKEEAGAGEAGRREEGAGAGEAGRREEEAGAGEAGRKEEAGAGEAGRREEGAGAGEAGQREEGAGAGEEGRREEGAGAGEAGQREEGAGAGEAGRREEGAGAGEAGRKEEAGAGEAGRREEGAGAGEAGRREEGAGAGEAGRKEEAGAGEAGRREEGAGAGEAGRREKGAGAGEAGRREEGAGAGEAGRREEGAGAGEAGRREEGAGAGEAGRREERARAGEAGRREEGAGAGEAGRREEGAGAGEAGRREEGAGAGEAGRREEGAGAGEPGRREEGKEGGGEMQREDGDGREAKRQTEEENSEATEDEKMEVVVEEEKAAEEMKEKGNNKATKEGEKMEGVEEKGAEEMKEKEVEKGNNKTNDPSQQENMSFTVNCSNEPDTREQTLISPQEKRPGSGPTSGHEPRGPPDLSDMMEFPLNGQGGAGMACLSLMSLGLLSVHVSIPRQMVVVDSNLVDNEVVKGIAALEEDDDDDDDAAEECEGRKRLEVKARQASHTNYLMMRGYCSPGIVKLRNLNPNDSIVVESCIMRVKLRNTPAHHMFNDEVSSLLDYMKCGPSLLPSNLNHSICFPSTSTSPSPSSSSSSSERGYSPQDIQACAELERSLEGAGHNGLGGRDLLQAHAHLAQPDSGRTRGLQQYMQELQEEGRVLRVGGLGVRYVLMQHARPWLLTSTSRNRSRSSAQSRSRSSELRKRGLQSPEHDVGPPRKRLTKVDEGQVVVGEAEERGEEDKRGETEEKRGEMEESGEVKERGKEDERGEVEEKGETDGPPRMTVKRSEGEKEGEHERRSGNGMINSEEEGGKKTLPEEEGQREREDEGGAVRGGEEKTEERGVRLEEEKTEERGVRVEEEKTEDRGVRVEEEKTEERGVRVEEEKTEERGVRVEEEKTEERGVRVEEEKTEERGVRVEEEKTEERGVRVEEEKMEEKETTECDAASWFSPPAPAAAEADSHDAGDVHFISRPWRLVDGSVNRPVCKGMLEAVLYHIMSRPGLTLHSLVEHYRDVLQPMVVLDLAEALIEMGCVRKRTVVRTHKPSLFSRPGDGAGFRTEETETVFYEPTISCCLRLAHVLPNQPHWNQFLQLT